MVLVAKQDPIGGDIVTALTARGDVVDLISTLASVLGDQAVETGAIPFSDRFIK